MSYHFREQIQMVSAHYLFTWFQYSLSREREFFENVSIIRELPYSIVFDRDSIFTSQLFVLAYGFVWYQTQNVYMQASLNKKGYANNE